MVMDLLVKGMKMPKSCGKCPMMRPGNYKGQAFPCTCHAKDCFPIKPSELDLRDGLCPLIEVPSADVAEVQHGEWIPVKERLPEEKCKCLVYKKHTRLSALVSFTNDLESIDNYDFQGQKRWGFFYYDSEYGYCESLGVTHWMPLPEPPKDCGK